MPRRPWRPRLRVVPTTIHVGLARVPALLAADPGLIDPAHAPLKDAVGDAFGHELGWLLKA